MAKPNLFRLFDININQFIISLKATTIDQFLDFKNNPVLTDVTFKVFKNYYLCSSVIYCDELKRYVPIYVAAIKELTANTFKNYFIDFFSAYHINFDEVSFLGMVMDFSAAQARGYLDAIKAVTGNDDHYGLKYLKGCYFHFTSSVTKLTKPFNIVLPLPDNLKSNETDYNKNSEN
jgi:hypothetical protein